MVEKGNKREELLIETETDNRGRVEARERERESLSQSGYRMV